MTKYLVSEVRRYMGRTLPYGRGSERRGSERRWCTRLVLILGVVAVVAHLAAAESAPEPHTPMARAWLILQQGITGSRAKTRANAAHALRLVVHDAKARELVEGALTDPNADVRAAAARSLGPMGALSSVPRLKGLLSDPEPGVVLAAAHSLFLLGERNEVYDLDCELVAGERKSADGFVQSQIKELRDPKVIATMGFETGVGFVPFGGEAYEVVKRVRKDDTTPVRAAAAKELASDPDPKIDSALARACADKKWAVRAAAVFAIAKHDDPALLSVVARALDDRSEIVRYEAAAAVLRLSAAGGSK